MPYWYYRKKKILGNDFEGHEMWQHANIKAQGLATERLSTNTSRDNPILVLGKQDHAKINNAQRVLGAKNQSPLENIAANYNILIENGIPEENASWAQILAVYNAEKRGGDEHG